MTKRFCFTSIGVSGFGKQNYVYQTCAYATNLGSQLHEGIIGHLHQQRMMHLLKHESCLCLPESLVAQEAALFASRSGCNTFTHSTAFSIAVGHTDNKPIIFVMKHIPLLSITANSYTTSPHNLDVF